VTAAPMERTTVIERVCAGASRAGCGRTYGRVEVAWSGATLLVSHGVCRRCFALERARLVVPREFWRGVAVALGTVAAVVAFGLAVYGAEWWLR